MYVFSPTMHRSPIVAPRRMWTLSQTFVCAPSVTPSSTSAVGWTTTPSGRDDICAHERFELHPLVHAARAVRGFDDADGFERVDRLDDRRLLAEAAREEVADLVGERFLLVVAAAEHDPIELLALPVPRLPPADLQRAVGAENADERLGLLVDAPAQIDGALDAGDALEVHATGIFDVEVLNLDAMLRLHRRNRAGEEPRDVDGVRAVVEEHAAAGDLLLRVPAAAHVDLAAEDVLEQHQLAQDSRVGDAFRL